METKQDPSCIQSWYLIKLMDTEPEFVNVYGAQELIPPAYVDWRGGTSNRVVVPARQAENLFLASLKGL
jgi:hypothetical protein